MMRISHLFTVLSVAFVPFLPGVAVSHPLATRTQYPEVSIDDTNMPICYMQTNGNQTLDLSKMCGSGGEANQSGGLADTPGRNNSSVNPDRFDSASDFSPNGSWYRSRIERIPEEN